MDKPKPGQEPAPAGSALNDGLGALMGLTNLFKSNTIRRKTKSGYSIRCKKGLWSVTAPTTRDAWRSAMGYFIQYLEDGEYA